MFDKKQKLKKIPEISFGIKQVGAKLILDDTPTARKYAQRIAKKGT